MTDSPRHQLGRHLRHGDFGEHKCSCGVSDREMEASVYGEKIGLKLGIWLGFLVGTCTGAIAIGIIG